MKLDNINSREISVILSTTKRLRNCSIDIPLIANIIGFVVHKEGLTELNGFQLTNCQLDRSIKNRKNVKTGFTYFFTYTFFILAINLIKMYLCVKLQTLIRQNYTSVVNIKSILLLLFIKGKSKKCVMFLKSLNY